MSQRPERRELPRPPLNGQPLTEGEIMTISPTKTVLIARVAALAAAVLGFALGPGGVATATPRPALVSTSIADDERPSRPDVVACDDDPGAPEPGDADAAAAGPAANRVGLAAVTAADSR